LKELIDEYSRSGYEILADYRDYKRPPKIGDYEPDLVIRKGNQEIVIEIVSKEQMKGVKRKLEHFARYADATKDVRFDIVLTNPRHRIVKQESDTTYREILRLTQRYLTVDVNVAYRRRQYNAAFYLLYDLLKSLLIEVAMKNSVPLREGRSTSLRTINDSLKEVNLIKKENYDAVRKIIAARNTMVHHGLEPGFQISRDYLDNARELVKALRKALA
jgi:hypothetical protein